jgi:uncharacterized membrane-anchored protein
MAGPRHRTVRPYIERSATRPEQSKVPDVTPWFWIVKILTTAMGEAMSDYLVNTINPYVAVLVGFVVFAVAIIWQFTSRTYRTGVYWFAVSMVAVFGTMCADVLHVGLGIPYKVTVIGFAILVALSLIGWYSSEKTLSIHSIVNRRREFFYWLTVVCTFALGTATGDLTAFTLHLGYLLSGIVFTLAILVPLVAWRLGVNPVLTFWVAYILTRPIGASFADFFGMPKASGGRGVGHGPVSLVTAILVIALVWYLAKTGKDLLAPRDAGGYGPRDSYGSPDTYGSPDGYGPGGGYGSADGYGPRDARAPHDGYAPRGGYAPPPEYAPRDGYTSRDAYGQRGEYAPEPDYHQRQGYESSRGYEPRPNPAGPSFTPRGDEPRDRQDPPPGSPW